MEPSPVVDSIEAEEISVDGGPDSEAARNSSHAKTGPQVKENGNGSVWAWANEFWATAILLVALLRILWVHVVSPNWSKWIANETPLTVGSAVLMLVAIAIQKRQAFFAGLRELLMLPKNASEAATLSSRINRMEKTFVEQQNRLERNIVELAAAVRELRAEVRADHRALTSNLMQLSTIVATTSWRAARPTASQQDVPSD